MKTAEIEAPPVPVMTATVTVTLLSDGSLWVPLYDVAAAVGGLVEYVLNRAQAHKVPVVPNSEGTLGLSSEDALGLIVKIKREQDEHSSRWQSYVAYREDKKREAAEKRDQAIREQREAEAKRSRLFATKAAEVAARRDAEERERREAEKAAREGAPAPFERWKPS